MTVAEGRKRDQDVGPSISQRTKATCEKTPSSSPEQGEWLLPGDLVQRASHGYTGRKEGEARGPEVDFPGPLN